jgi:predicted transcriptional regulator
MAKKKSGGPKPKPQGPLPNVVSMRGQPEWREWLGRLAEKCRATPSGVIDRALAELAKREGFEEPPPRL